jgi:hypothetical protein
VIASKTHLPNGKHDNNYIKGDINGGIRMKLRKWSPEEKTAIFSFQQAWNYVNSGPVGKAAEKISSKNKIQSIFSG